MLGLLLALPVARGGERRSELLNFDWRFRLGEQSGAERPGYDDRGWETVQLPHDASIYGPFVRDTLGGDRANGYRPRNVGWYRKHLTVARKPAGRRFLLEFEGVYRAAEVWVNGRSMGIQLNGYLDFEYDVTDALHEGDNLVAVRYDNRYKASSRWYTGEGGGYSYFGYDHASAVGQFYWGGTEYIGESFGWPSKGWINGAVDLCDNLKPVGWSIRSLYSDEPMVRIAVHDRTAATERVWNDLKMRSKPMHLFWKGEPGDTLDVQTFSNCEEVELRLNGRTLGRRRMADCPRQRMIWRVAYQPGEMVVVGYDGGRAVAEQRLCSASEPVRLVLRPEATQLRADGMSLLYVNVEVQDAAGNVVPTSDFDVRFGVEGPATIAGVCNGDITSDEPWQADRRHVHEGRALVILRASRRPGTVRLTASARGLKSDRIGFECVPAGL